ncbi:sensor histidine kinase [Massilia sp. TN1-12]|uniref:sensor histidine kinase n=1 Tax=Massilia paldalensis TaxID=3377675 RepID=UPI00384F4E2C
MLTLDRFLPACAPGTSAWPRLRRFADDLGWTVIVSTWAGVVLTLAAGRPQELYEQVVYSLCVGLVALLILDGMRLLVLGDPAQRPRWARTMLVLIVATAPVAHYAGIALGGLVLGRPVPDLAGYPSVPRVSLVLFTLLAICVVVLLVLARERVERIKGERAEARTRAERIERQALQAQLRLLQAQIEPHMLFNTLANLQGLIAIDPARAGAMLDHLIQYLRATLAATRLDTTTLAEECDAIDAYLGLMGVRMGPRLRHRVTLPDALRGARMPPMLLQPLVENAIIHGLEPHVDGGEIVVEAAARDGMLEVCVRDTGIGIPGDAGGRGGGIGLATTRERLQALYGTRAALVLAPATPRGTLARLTIPLETA